MSDKLVGGVQGLRLGAHSLFGEFIFGREHGLYANARSALYAITQVREFKCVWLPSYLCDTVLLPFIKAGLELKFYFVDHLLVPNFDEVSIQEGDVVLLISYYGVPTEASHYASLKAKGACIIEDLSQAVYSTPSKFADFSIYSLRKFFAVPDGGVVISKNAQVNWPYTSSADRLELQRGIEAVAGRSLFDAGLSDSKEWVTDFQKSEAAMKTELLSMSSFTKTQIAGFIDFESDKNRRTENFDYLLSELQGISLIQDRKGAVPLGFPIVVCNRDEVRQVLFEHEIYPPIHWNIEGVVPFEFTESHKLSAQIMTIPCDGRYNLQDMQRVVAALRGACICLS